MKNTLATIIVVCFVSFCSLGKAQVTFNNGAYQLTPVNNGTGSIVSIPIGISGLSISVATGSAALPLQYVNNNPLATQLHLGDDTSANVPIGFNFPYWGQTFSNSWMYSNGLLSFTTGNIPGAGCCGGQNLATLASQRNTTYNYMIAPLWTDLIDTANNATWVLKNSNSITYGWYNTREYGTSNQSSFEINLNYSGAMSVKFGSAFVSSGHTVTSGMTGDLSKGQYFQYYYGQGFGIPTSNPVSWGTSGSFDQCISNPLSSQSCSGYQAAYTSQQCSINALYDPSCPGYTAANFTYQCSINPLYDVNCSGYQQAYHNQQCSLNPLYATDCIGYAQAYFNQQCSLNPLYSSNCPGYQQAYFNQQCQSNGLYSTQCPNYGTAYATQQALQQSQPSTTRTTTVISTQSTSAPPVAGTVSSTGTVSNPTQVPVVSDPVVNNIITTNNTPTTASTTTITPTNPVTTTVSSTTSPSTSAPTSNQSTTTAEAPKSNSTPPTKAQVAAAAKVAASNVESNKSMEEQIKVQGVVVGAMSYVPGFDAYKIVLPDSPFYKPFTVYNNQVNVDNRRASRALFGATDLTHEEMLKQQYK